MAYQAPFGTKQRLKEYMGDFFAEVPEGYDIQDVIDVIFEELDSWIEYHNKNAKVYETIRDGLTKRVPAAWTLPQLWE